MAAVRPQPKSDAYTGMLGISLAALVIGTVLVYLDYARYPKAEAPKVQRSEMPAPAQAEEKKPEEKQPQPQPQPGK
jgi:hypothetical protein